MKSEIHPAYAPIVFRDLASGETFLTRSTATSDKTIELDESTAEYLGVHRAEAAHEPNTVVSAAVFAVEISAETTAALTPHGEIDELLWIDRLDGISVELAPLTRDELLPLWASRRAGATLF